MHCINHRNALSYSTPFSKVNFFKNKILLGQFKLNISMFFNIVLLYFSLNFILFFLCQTIFMLIDCFYIVLNRIGFKFSYSFIFKLSYCPKQQIICYRGVGILKILILYIQTIFAIDNKFKTEMLYEVTCHPEYCNKLS